MNDQYPAGEVIVGRLVSQDLFNIASYVPFYTEDGIETYLRNGDRLIISNMVVNNEATAKLITIFFDNTLNGTYDAGEELLTISFADAGFVQLVGLDLPSRKVAGAASWGGLRLHAQVLGAHGNVSIFITGKIIRS
jgi:hypothetical protein